jgi:hypothetical protein
MRERHQADIAAAVREVAGQLLDRHSGLGPSLEDADFRPAVVAALQNRGFRAQSAVPLTTKVRPHPFDIVWERGGDNGAIELKLKARTAPVDDSRLFFWYDLKWLESGIEAGSIGAGTAVLLTDLRQLYEESGRGDWRHDYYRIGHRNIHRCKSDGPDHLFERRYKPVTQFLPELHPLSISGCYDFRDKWRTLSSGSRAAFLLVVPVSPPSADNER